MLLKRRTKDILPWTASIQSKREAVGKKETKTFVSKPKFYRSELLFWVCDDIYLDTLTDILG